ncbi:Zinc finger C2H2-type [Sesbania bispinosa]|nr:Zinc finger C2H2-type [Sesbania bispinosa]
MANGIGNWRHDMFNYAQDNTSNQTACRLCNQGFINTQALITHIESHIEHEEAAIRRLYNSALDINSHKQVVSHHFPSSSQVPKETQNITECIFSQSSPQPLTMPQPKRNPFFSPSQICSSQPVRQMQLLPQVLSSAGNEVAGIAELSTPQFYQRKLAEESPKHATKAYIMQLEKPIKKTDLVNIDDDKSEVQTLDLALKL